MAFMTPPAAATGAHEANKPIMGFNAKAGRLFLLDRAQDAAGEWLTIKTDITMQQPAFAVDFGTLETGWIWFAGGRAPVHVMAPYGAQYPAMPDSPGTSNTGRPLRFKAGFRVQVVGQRIGGVREFSGNSAALIGGMNELHSLYEAASEARAGQIPVIQMTDIAEVQNGQSANYQPVFTIVTWADRPAPLGPRTVPAPGATLARIATPAQQPASPRVASPPGPRPGDERRDTEDWRSEFYDAPTKAPARTPPAHNGHAARPVSAWDAAPGTRDWINAEIAF